MLQATVKIGHDELFRNNFLKNRELVDQLDLATVTSYCTKEYNWTNEYAEQIEDFYRDFLALYATDFDGQYVGTKEVDLYWHVHVLHTRIYRAQCEEIFGRFLDHDPVDVNVVKDLTPYTSTYDRTFELLSSLGREPIVLRALLIKPEGAICYNASDK